MIKLIMRWIMFLIVAFMGFIALLLTPMGLKTGLFLASWIIPGKFEYRSASGLMIGPIEILDLNYHYKDYTLTIDRLYLQWHLLGLFREHIQIESLNADHVRLSYPPPRTDPNITEKFWEKIDNQAIEQLIHSVKKFHWALNLGIDDVEIHNLILQPQLSPARYHIKYMQLRGEILKHSVHLNVASQITNPQVITIKSSLNGTPQNYKFLFSANNKSLSWNAEAHGDENHLTASLQSNQGLQNATQADVVLQWAPTILFSGNLIAPQNKLQFQAKYQQYWQLQWNAALLAIQNLYPQIHGQLQSQGSWNGAFPQITSQGSLQLQAFNYQDYNVNNLKTSWNIDWQQQHTGQFQLQSNTLNWRHKLIDQFNIVAHGDLSHHTVQGSLKNQKLQIQWALTGQWLNALWNGQLTQLTVSNNSGDNLHLAAMTPLSINNNIWNVANLCLISKNKDQVCFNTTKTASQEWTASINSPQLHLSRFTSLLSPNLKLDGSTSFSINANGNPLGLQQAQWQFNFNKGSATYESTENTLKSTYKNSQLRGNFDNTGLHNLFKLNLPYGDYLTLQLGLPKAIGKFPQWSQQPLNGMLTANIQHVSMISALIPNTVIPQGVFVANVGISGTVSNPLIQGQAGLKDGEIEIPPLNVTLKKVNVGISGANGLLSFNAIAYSEDQPLTIKGTSQLSFPNWTTAATVSGKDVLLVNTKEYILFCSPQLNANIHGRQVDLTGSITLSKGVIKPFDFRHTVTLPKNDIIFIGKPVTTHTNPWQITSNIDLLLGDDVDADTEGLLGKLYGHVMLSSQPGQPFIATGRVGVSRGTYSAFGRTLIMDPSSFIEYTKSPFSNPNLNLRATRIVKSVAPIATQMTSVQYILGIQFQGTFKDPKPTLFSIPANLSQADILSYMLFDTLPNVSAAGNLSLLVQALDVLKPGNSEGLLQSQSLVDQIRQGLGFSELGVESETTLDTLGSAIDQRTAFVVGRHITDRIYIRYTRDISLEAPGIPNMHELTVSYFLTPRWSLQTYNNTLGTGADLLYTVEKN